MPTINVILNEKYDQKSCERLSQRLTDATVSVVNAPAELVTVVINELAPAGTVSRKGESSANLVRPVLSEMVKCYLSAMEKRDLAAAETFLAKGFRMTFPGNATFTRLTELIEWSALRYRSIAKTYERFDECYGAEESIVYCYGTLQGVWLDGSTFSGIRFIDRFSITGGLFTSQLVWNDMAESVTGK